MSIEQDITVIIDERDQLKEWLRKSSTQIEEMDRAINSISEERDELKVWLEKSSAQIEEMDRAINSISEERDQLKVWLKLSEQRAQENELEVKSIKDNFAENIMPRLYKRLADEILSVDDKEIEAVLTNRKAFISFEERHSLIVKFENALIDILENAEGGARGTCVVCNSTVDFTFSKGLTGFREDCKCSSCGYSSRTRYMVERIFRSGANSDSSIYIYEQVTGLYKYLKEQFPNLIGSEYLGSEKKSGQEYNGIRHEDAMNLSFEDNKFELLVSADVFEHISDCDKAFKEAHRVLKPGGKLIISVPVFWDNDVTVKRATISDAGELIHYMEPQYHGNPTEPEKGSLVFNDFGIDILEKLKEAGFNDAYFVAYYSVSKCYMGYLPLIIEAVK